VGTNIEGLRSRRRVDRSGINARLSRGCVQTAVHDCQRIALPRSSLQYRGVCALRTESFMDSNPRFSRKISFYLRYYSALQFAFYSSIVVKTGHFRLIVSDSRASCFGYVPYRLS